jgi:ABC-type antimicrobial peptide transport system permease subunit
MALPLRYSLGNLAVRRTRTALTVAVIALVVVATSLFMGLISSLQRTLATTGNERNLIVLRKGSSNDGSSSVSLEAFQAIRFFEGVQRGADGQPLASPELVVQPFLRRLDGGRENGLVRGVEPVALRVHDEVRLSEGRMLTPSTTEAIIGRGVAGRYAGAQLDAEMEFGNGTWQVVGVFESGGSSFESEIWVDARQLAADARRPQPYSGFRLRVAPGHDPDALARRIGDDPRYALEASRETDYYAEQAESARTLYVIAVGLALLAGVGAAFGAANTLYASVQARRAEIGTLRALGFPRGSILLAFLTEALALALAGFALGALLAWLLARLVSWLLGGVGFPAITFTTSIVRLEVGGSDLALALLLALAIGLVGGFAPALRAARLRPVEALRKA